VANKSAPRSTKKPQSTKKQPDIAYPGMMGDGTQVDAALASAEKA
jgi:hypothetical protein